MWEDRLNGEASNVQTQSATLRPTPTKARRQRGTEMVGGEGAGRGLRPGGAHKGTFTGLVQGKAGFSRPGKKKRGQKGKKGVEENL